MYLSRIHADSGFGGTERRSGLKWVGLQAVTAGGGYTFHFFPLRSLGFWYLVVPQSFHWYLISRDKSCIVTQFYEIVLCGCLNRRLFEVSTKLETHVSKLLSVSHL